jgi:hypothetical protein
MPPVHSITRGPALFLLALLAMACAHAEVADLYTGTAPVASQDEAERARALRAALVSALVRASGDSTLTGDSRLAPLLDKAPQWVQNFGYRQEVEASSGSAPVVREYLQARFDPVQLAAALAAIGRSVWAERPRTLLWLVIDDGSTRRIASAAQVSALDALSRHARERGISIQLPTMDAKDIARVDADTLWSGPSSAAYAASSRYGTPIALVVRLARSGASWSGRFSLADGARSDDWSGNYADANAALVAAVSGLADRLAQRYAVAAVERVVGDYVINIAGVNSAEDFARVQAYLAGLSVLSAFATTGAEGTTLTLAATLNVTPARLRQVLTVGGVLVFDDGALADERRIGLRLVR